MNPLRLAVVGAGYMGRLHALKVADLAREDGSVELTAVAEPDAKSAETVARETGSRVVSDVREVLSEVDAVIVAVPTVEHFGVVEAALAAGLDVLVEKPIAARLEEADKLFPKGYKQLKPYLRVTPQPNL